MVTVRPDGFLFGIAEIACGEAFKLFTELQLPIVHTACIVLSQLFFSPTPRPAPRVFVINVF